MNRLLTVPLLALFLVAGTSSVFAQAEIIKGKAKNIRDANNARQGIAPVQPAAAAPAAPAAPSGPQGLSATQQALIDKLEIDISNLKPGFKPADDQRKQMQADILALAKGATKPSPQSLTNLVTHLSTALSVKEVSLKDPGPAQLAKDVNIVVNSMNLSAGQVQPIIVSAQNLLRGSGVSEDNYKPVVADLKTIVADLQKNKPRLYQ